MSEKEVQQPVPQVQPSVIPKPDNSTSAIALSSEIPDNSAAYAAATISGEAELADTEVVSAAQDYAAGDNKWHNILPELSLSGMAKQLAEHCLMQQLSDDVVSLQLDDSGEALLTESTEQVLTDTLSQYLQQKIKLQFKIVAQLQDTPEKRRLYLDAKLQQQAEQAIEGDPVIQQLREQWGAVILPGSIRPNRDDG